MKQLIKPKNKYQEEYIRTVLENKISLITGCAGVGKTAIAVGLACEKFLNGEIKKIVYTRPFVNTGKGIGWLAGSTSDKTRPYFLPALDEFGKYFTTKQMADLRKEKLILIEPLEFMRGSNFYDCYMILAEAQNASKEQIRMFVTRMSNDNTKCILEGDILQCDLHECEFSKFVAKFESGKVRDIATYNLPHEAIVRSKIISSFIRNTDNI